MIWIKIVWAIVALCRELLGGGRSGRSRRSPFRHLPPACKMAGEWKDTWTTQKVSPPSLCCLHYWWTQNICLSLSLSFSLSIKVTFQISRFHFSKKKKTETQPENQPETRGCGNPRPCGNPKVRQPATVRQLPTARQPVTLRQSQPCDNLRPCGRADFTVF